MERELWKSMYQLARECENFRHFRAEIFFRFDDRGSVLLGGDPRSAG